MITLSLLGAFAVVSFAAETLDAPEGCPVMGQKGSYAYDPTMPNGPQHWGDIEEDFVMCKEGHKQSPIDMPLPSEYKSKSEGPEPMMMKAEYTFSGGSYNWAISCATAGTCGYTMLGGKKFHVVNLHFHSKSEHHLNGYQYPLEAHIVHMSDDGQLAVIATMFNYPDETTYAAKVYAGYPMEYESNRLLARLLSAMEAGAKTVTLNLGMIVRPLKGYCSYVGSLTTPKCSEGVTFFMANHVEMVTKRQVASYKMSAGAGHDGNNRPTMPLNGRTVTCYI